MKAITRLLPTALILLYAGAPSLVAEGIPEPPAVFYGTIRNLGTFNSRVTSGMLTWRLTKYVNELPAGSFTQNASLGNILGQFSYVMEIPCETELPAALSTSTNAMILKSTTTDYYRFEIFVDGSPATFLVATQNTFAALQRSRGLVTRIDLTINSPCADLNNNKICDWWEDRYFGDFVDAHADPDGDGMNNLTEFQAGTDPTDSNSAFIFTEYRPQPSGGFLVEWNSAEGRSYTLLSTPNLLASNNFSVVRSNLPATPPKNTFLDTNTLPTGPRFYQLKLEL